MVHFYLPTELFKLYLILFHPQEKQELLRQFVSSGENLDTIETTLRISRSQTGELERNKELLTIAEMRQRGVSASLKAMLSKRFCHEFPC